MSENARAIARAYAAALRRVVAPGARVLDLGGDFGRSAVLACRFGAEHVYSVQTAQSLAIARAVAHANGYAAHIQCVEQLDELPGQIDVIVNSASDELPVHGLSLLSHPVARLAVAHGATPIPRHERLSAAIVNAPELYRRHSGVWDIGWGLDFSVARGLTLNAWSLGRVEPSQLLSEPREWATLDYMSSTTSIAGQLDSTVARAGIAHGFAVWPEATLAEGIVIANVPGVGGAAHGDAFFPWLEPVGLVEGDQVSLSIRADMLGTGNVWTWTSVIRRAAADTISFKQSTFFGSLHLPA